MPAGIWPPLVLATLIGLAIALSNQATGHDPPKTRPNIVVIQLDDQVYSDLFATYRTRQGAVIRVLPNTSRLLIRQGVLFKRYYVSVPVCCPSRAALLTGRYARNNGVFTNAGKRGGFTAFRRHDLKDNVAVWLQHAGYRTIHVGKFLNGYSSTPAAVPPGWSDWQTLATDPATSHYYGYRINDNGKLSRPYGDANYRVVDSPSCPGPSSTPCNYVTDVLTKKALGALKEAPATAPFYLQVDYTAPHGDDVPPIGPPPPPRYLGSLVGIKAPRVPSFNERNVSDKPKFGRLELLDSKEIATVDFRYEARLEAERAVDDGVGRLVGMLRRRGELQNTYIFLISDNGYFQGEHRYATGKFLPYEPSNRMPLVVRGPGIPHGKSSEALNANVDLAPTFLQISGGRATRPPDGRSLLRFAQHPRLRSRRPILLEDFTQSPGSDRRGRSSARVPHAYEGIRVGPYKYIRYGTGDQELYQLARDPYELQSLVWDQRYQNVIAWLAGHLKVLVRCQGVSCQRPVGPIPKPARSAPPWANP